MGDKSGRDQQTKPFEFRPGVGGFPALGGMDRSRDPAGIAPWKAHLLINARRKEGGWVSRGGQAKLFADRLHAENVGEGGDPLWDEATGIGAITGIDPGVDEIKYGARQLYCGTGELFSTFDGAVQRNYSISLLFGAGTTAAPLPTFDIGNGSLWGYKPVMNIDGVTIDYYQICRMGNVNNVFGVTPVFVTPKLSTWAGTEAGIPVRMAWSAPDTSYYMITDNGLVLSFSEAGVLAEEEDHSLDTVATVTVYGVPVIFETNDQVVYLVGYGTGIAEPTTMQPPLCYVKNLHTGVWSADSTIVDNFVPLTRPVFHNGEFYVGGYFQATTSASDKNGAVLIYHTNTGWETFAGPFTGNSPVRGLCRFGQFVYYVYDDVVNVNNSILGRFWEPTVYYNTSYYLFFTDFPTTTAPCDGIFPFRGRLFARLYRSDVPYDGEGHLYQSDGSDVTEWTVIGSAASGDPANQVLRGAPDFVI